MPQDLNQKHLQQLATVECQDTTFPFKNPALVFDRAQGSYIWDVEGHRYLDLCAGFGALPLGHAHTSVLRVFAAFQSPHSKKRDSYTRDQAYPMIMGLGDLYPSYLKIEFLMLLKSFLPDHLSKGSLGLSGSHAVEIALKTAQLATKKSGFICFNGSYHGLDLGILPITSRTAFKAPFKHWIKESNVISLPLNCKLDLIDNAFLKQIKQGIGTAGLILEPIQGRAGVVMSHNTWLKELRNLTKKYNVPLIFDEVLTGCGRSGRFTFADETPCDLLCLGKAIGGGFPLSACFGTEKMMRSWPKSHGEAIHTGTFFGHPFSCAVGIETLNIMRQEKLVTRSKTLGQKLLTHLRKRFLEVPKIKNIKDIRGSGLMLSLEFSKPNMGVKVMNKLRQKSIIALVSGDKGQCISFTPALNIDEDVLFDSIDKLKKVIEDKP